jgi:Spy/CpxP family protein refolding chaperone
VSFIRLAPLFFALSVAFGAPLGALAQTPPPAADAAPPAPAPHHHHHHGASFWRALRTINLSPAQRRQIADLRAAARSANLTGNGSTQALNMRTLRGHVMAVLTPDQRDQLEVALHRKGNDAVVPAPAASSAPPGQ